MRMRILAIGMIVLIAASAFVISASAGPDKSIKFDENKNVVTFVGVEDGDEIFIILTENQHQWQYNYTYNYNYTYVYERCNLYRVQIIGNETLIPLNFADSTEYAPAGKYNATARINEEIELDFELVVV